MFSSEELCGLKGTVLKTAKCIQLRRGAKAEQATPPSSHSELVCKTKGSPELEIQEEAEI